MIYIIVIIYTICAALLYCKYEKDKYRNLNLIMHSGKMKSIEVRGIKNCITFLLMISPAICIAGFRYDIANDYLNVYVPGFKTIQYWGLFSTEFEVGFEMLNKICSYIMGEPWFMFFICSMVTILIYFLAFEYNSRNFALSVALFFVQGVYFDTFNGIRQYIVVAIFLYAYKYIKSGEFYKYAIIMGASCFIHLSALMAIPMYFLKKIKLNYLYATIILGALYLLKSQLYYWFFQIMAVMPRARSYIDKGTLTNYVDVDILDIVTAIIYLTFFALVRKKMIKSEEGIFLLNIGFLDLAFGILSSTLPLMYRFLYMTKSYFLLSFPFAVETIEKKNNKIIIIVGVVSLISMMNLYGIINYNWYGIIPYKSILGR